MLSLKTPGKINYFLKVLDKRADNYHNIETIFVPLDGVYDLINIELKDEKGISIISNSGNIPCNENNLCYKAANLFSKLTNLPPQWLIKIEKNIPIAAGMGGGSSDAAATILLLQKLHNIKISKNELIVELSKLGADIPYFLNPVPSSAEGIGEKITPIKINFELNILISAPSFPVSAAWAYKNIEKPKKCETLLLSDALISLSLDNFEKINYAKNDLAGALLTKFPLLTMLKNDLQMNGSLVTEISGSGPSLFSIFKNFEIMRRSKKYMQDKYGDSIRFIESKVLETPYIPRYTKSMDIK